MEEIYLRQLRSTLDEYESTANFCCGGSIPVPDEPPTYGDVTSEKSKVGSPPITLRFEGQDGSLGKVVLPGGDVENLIKACTPATFGNSIGDVYDENIRKAGKLDNTQFSSSFSPYDFGIVEAVGRALAPGVRRFAEDDEIQYSSPIFVAELYKLNVYSAPGDKFTEHIDTPRGPTHFGSLVVSLPTSHSGGELRVNHKGHSKLFAFSSDSAALNITWAAFYSDCKHEVLPVVSGHRITLTYNLFLTHGHRTRKNIQESLVSGLVIDPEYYPIYQTLAELLQQPGFMNEGGDLGWFCEHMYAHTDQTFDHRCPQALKGLDFVLLSVFQSLGLKPEMRPVHEGVHNRGYSDEDNEPKSTVVGRRFRPVEYSNSEIGEGESVLDDGWSCNWFGWEDWEDITWLNEKFLRGKLVAMTFARYGNEYSADFVYSFAAIFVNIPPFADRNHGTGSSGKGGVTKVQEA
ncbi:hypothetical protein B0O99DRAFT_226059 [Bisporella sp. PMI_857]|nr:hypothetical protein B0O99DRAFT_226059 [Bisporella sp. PMI_857]